MKISELYAKRGGRPVVSVEIFPPKKDEAFENVGGMLKKLKEVAPAYIGVTCGAGGSGTRRNKTVELASKIKNEYGIESMAHLTCIASTEESIEAELGDIKKSGIENVLALRGDIPKEGFDESRADYRYAYRLIEKIKAESDLFVAAAAYPEGHIECEDLATSVEYVKMKQDAGAELLVTQLFFSNEYFYNFMEEAAKHNITVPVTAGIMPMMSKSQISNMIFTCGASLPSAMIKILNKYESNPDDLLKAGIEYAGAQIRDLVDQGAQGIHIYSMNKPDVAARLAEYI